MLNKDLYKKAVEYYNLAYAPYSKFHVGAVIEFEDGSTIGGCNVENASYGLSICAERAAIFNAIASNKDLKKVKEMVVVANTKKPVSPCGACRQVLKEFLDKKVKIYITNLNEEYLEFDIDTLLPYSFDLNEDRV